MDAALDKWRHQADGKAMLIQAIREGFKEIQFMQATGSGKTYFSADIIKGAVEKGNRSWFLTDQTLLLDQTLAEFEKLGLRCGVIQGNHEQFYPDRLVQVCTPQTLKKRLVRDKDIYLANPPNIVFIDESHFQWNVREDIQVMFPGVLIIGLSATPFAKKMGLFYKHLIKPVAMKTLEERGVLIAPRILEGAKYDMKGAKTSAGDFADKETTDRIKGEVIGDIITNYKEHADGEQAVVFGVNVAHSKLLCQMFVDAGIDARHIDGYDSDDNQETIAAFKRGEFTILCNCMIAVKGFDFPQLKVCILAFITKSKSKIVQCIGRVARSAEGKTWCLVLDHGGNVSRMGSPVEIDAEFVALNTGTKGEPTDNTPTEKEPKPCSACGALKTTHKCPFCGFAPEGVSEVDHVAGFMREYVASDDTSEDCKRWTKAKKLRFMRMFMYIYNIERQNKKGAALYAYDYFFKEDPQNKWVKPVDPQENGAEGVICRNMVALRDKNRATHLRIKNANRPKVEA